MTGRPLHTRRGPRALLALAVAAGALQAAPPEAQAAIDAPPTAGAAAPAEPYTLTVWARVLFGTDGKPSEIALVDAEAFPTAFADAIRTRVARATIPPPSVDGRPATLRSGVELSIGVTPGPKGATMKITGVELAPIPLQKYLASYPKDIGKIGGWEGEAVGICRIGVDGRCASIEVQALPGMPESVRKHVRASLERWVFEPQQLAGQPIEGEYRLTLKYHTIDSQPEDFRTDKFERLQRNR